MPAPRVPGALVLLVALALAAPAAPALAAPAAARPLPAAPAAPGTILARFRAAATAAERTAARARIGARSFRSLPIPGVEALDVPAGAGAALERAAAEPAVLWAEPDRIRTASATRPDDPRYPEMWALENTGQTGGTAGADIDAPDAWDHTTGGTSVLVAVVDSGIDLTHPDLATAVWTNPGESGIDPMGLDRRSNGLDDDSNGYTDDWRGWDWIEHDNDPTDENGHGTHVAGTIGARGNDGTGITGVAWRVSLLPLRALDETGQGTDADVASAFAYAAALGARVVNASFGGDGVSQTVSGAIAAAPGTLFVVASGNQGRDNDAAPTFPCNDAGANVVCVAATTATDALSSFSNFGAASVDLGAPGSSILSTAMGGGYLVASGTSMASPQVAGAAALALARFSSATVAQTKDALLRGTDPDPALAGRTASGGRLNACGALAVLGGGSIVCGAPPPGPSPSPDTDPPTGAAIGGEIAAALQPRRSFALAWSATDAGSGVASYDVDYARASYSGDLEVYRSLKGATTITGSTFTGYPGYTYCFRVRARDAAGNVSAWSPARCTAIPLDDRSLGWMGTSWFRGSGPGFYLRTNTAATRAGSRLASGAFRGRRIWLLAERCPGCGTVDVMLGALRMARISLEAGAPAKVILPVATFPGVREGAVMVVVVSSGDPVRIDGLGLGK